MLDGDRVLAGPGHDLVQQQVREALPCIAKSVRSAGEVEAHILVGGKAVAEARGVDYFLGLDVLELNFLKYLLEGILKLYSLEQILGLYFLRYIFERYIEPKYSLTQIISFKYLRR